MKYWIRHKDLGIIPIQGILIPCKRYQSSKVYICTPCYDFSNLKEWLRINTRLDVFPI